MFIKIRRFYVKEIKKENLIYFSVFFVYEENDFVIKIYLILFNFLLWVKLCVF